MSIFFWETSELSLVLKCAIHWLFLYYKNYYGYKNKTRIRQENKIGYK